MFTKKETQVTGLQLTKMSENNEVKTYFTRVFELKQSGKEFPVNLDKVWPLVYNQKGKALATLRSDFVEGEDFYLSQMGKVINYNELKKGVRIDAYLTVNCMEYFIAKKVKPVFEVYRSVFHNAVDDAKNARKQLNENASDYRENTVITVKMGSAVNQIYVSDGVIFAKISPIMRYIGYTQGVSRMYVERIGEAHFKKITTGTREAWFVDVNGFARLLEMTNIPINGTKMNDVYRIFRAESTEPTHQYTYFFTDADMLNILTELMQSPVNKIRVQQMMLNGKKITQWYSLTKTHSQWR